MVVMPPHLRSIVDHDGAVILDGARNAMTTLDAGGAYIWERLQRGLEVDAIIAELTNDTGAEESVVANDVREFMEQLKSRHLVKIS